jgi:hypothetical protein
MDNYEKSSSKSPHYDEISKLLAKPNIKSPPELFLPSEYQSFDYHYKPLNIINHSNLFPKAETKSPPSIIPRK